MWAKCCSDAFSQPQFWQIKRSAWDFRFDQGGKLRERLLPAEMAHLERNGVGDAGLHDADVGSAGDLLQRDGGFHLAGQVRIIEVVRVANLLGWHELSILAGKGVALARTEIREGHFVRAANSGIHLMDLACEAI